MNLVHKTKQRYLVSLATEELTGISNALNEVCHGSPTTDAEFQTRLGCSRSELASILQRLGDLFAADDAGSVEIADALSDGGSVQIRAISVFGDPVDMSAEEALSFAGQITRCAREADAG